LYDLDKGRNPFSPTEVASSAADGDGGHVG
jgi:hypothetical protein